MRKKQFQCVMQALAQDQLRALLEMTRSLSVSFNIGIYDGDTSQEHRMWIRDNARLVKCSFLMIFSLVICATVDYC